MKSRFILTVAGALTASITFGAPVIESQRLHVRVGGDVGIHPALAELLATVPRQQRPGGYFCASGVIDWQKPLDSVEDGS